MQSVSLGFPVPSDKKSTQTSLKHKWKFIGSVNNNIKSVTTFQLLRCSNDLPQIFLHDFGSVTTELGWS